MKLEKILWVGGDYDDFNELFESGSVSVFDVGRGDSKANEHNNLRLFSRDESNEGLIATSVDNTRELTFITNEDIGKLSGDICMCQGKSLPTFAFKYPYRARYALYRVNLSPYWSAAFPGLLRRIYLGALKSTARVNLKGVVSICQEWDSKKTLWLVMKNRNATVRTHFSLSPQVGIEGMLKFFNEQMVNYVVLRFFEKMPEKYRDGGDVDILVDDKDYIKVSNYLTENPGSEMIDMYGVTTPATPELLPYYPPRLARRLLDNKLIGPGGASVPSGMDYLNSFIYHCLYHKGLSSGIPTEYKNLKPYKKPDNDYLAKINEMAELNNVEIGHTLEELDVYMEKVGWKPHLDTLEFIGRNNIWVKEHISNRTRMEEIGLNVVVIKKGGLLSNELRDYVEYFVENDFEIIYESLLDECKIEYSVNYLRGGNWTSGNNGNYMPAAIIIIKDISVVTRIASKIFSNITRIRIFKTRMRKDFPRDQESMIHITDNTDQAVDYIRALYPERLAEFIDHSNKTSLATNFFSSKKILLLLHLLSYAVKKSIMKKMQNLSSVLFR